MFLSAPLREDEPQRLARLRALAVLDTAPEALFDALAEAAAAVCETPIALVCLIEEHRQWCKARVGTEVQELPRNISFCAHTILQEDLMIVESMLDDERFADNPLVSGVAVIRFYAGVPVALSDGTVLGTLCVLDRVARTLSPGQQDALRKLGRSVSQAFESRERANDALVEAHRAKARIDELYRSTPAALFSMDGKGVLQIVSDKLLHDTGFARDELVGHTFFEFLTPASGASARAFGMPALLRDGRTLGNEYQLIRKDGQVMDILVSQVLERDEHDRPVRSMSVFEDITLRKAAERALRKEQDRIERIIAGTQAGLWEYNLVTGESTYGDQLAVIMGYTPEELLAITSEEFRLLVHPDDLEPALVAFNDYRSERTPFYECEFRVRHKQGHWVWLFSRAIATQHAADGSPIVLEGTRIDISHRKSTEAALQSSQSFLERVGNIAGVGGYEIDLRSGRISWSDQICRMHECEPGYSPTLAESRSFLTASSAPIMDAAIRDCIGQGATFDIELELLTTKGRKLWARAVGSAEYENGRAVRLVGAMQDVTKRKEIESELAQHRELLQVTLDSIGDAVITTDTSARVQWLNPVAERMTGWTKADAVGRALPEVFIVVDERTREPLQDPASICLEKQSVVEMSERITLIARNGREYGIEDSASPIRDASGQIHGAVLVFHDVSEQRRLVDEMSHRATHDLLTGLLNRGEFETRLARALEAHLVDGSDHVLLYIDLDQFKIVNDACGHSAGDQLLRQVAAILRGCVRSHDTVARLGGDEFGIILDHCDVMHAQSVAQKICDGMDAFRFTYESRRFRIGTSIGLVLMDDRWTSIKTLLQVADASCYAAKDSGRNRVHTWFDSDQVVEARHGDMQWVSRIELAIDEDRFELFGQRIESIKDPARGLHFEVLLRMREASGATIPPGAFLPVAERFHLATRLDRWVVNNAFQWMRDAEDGDIDIEMMSINLSGQSLGDRAFHRDVLQMIGRASFEVRKLCFEITETAAITHLTDARTFIEELRTLGVKVALDDFGAGASSFGYLKSLPVDFLKIDGHFIKHVLDDELNNAAVRCFCDVAKVIGVKTIAEFVEDEPIRNALREIGVDMVQGYLIHRPEPLRSLLTACAVA